MTENVFNYEQQQRQDQAQQTAQTATPTPTTTPNQQSAEQTQGQTSPEMSDAEALRLVSPTNTWTRVAADMMKEKERKMHELTSSVAKTSPLPKGAVRGRVEMDRIYSNTPYNIYGSETTNNKTTVYVDKYPTQTWSDEEKERLANKIGSTLGAINGIATGGLTAVGGAPIAIAAEAVPIPGLVPVLSGIVYGVAAAAGRGAYEVTKEYTRDRTREILDIINPNRDIKRDGKKEYAIK